jgi:hypothetical protein
MKRRRRRRRMSFESCHHGTSINAIVWSYLRAIQAEVDREGYLALPHGQKGVPIGLDVKICMLY